MPRTRGPDYERKRYEIAEGAAAVFAERGYHATRIEDIAAALGIGRTTIYWYFPDKEAILRALYERKLMTLLDAIRGAVAAAGDAPGRLLGYARAEIGFNIENREYMRILVSIWAGGREAFQHDFEQTLRGARTHGLAYMAELIAAGVRDGDLRPVDPDAQAAFLQAAIDGLTYNLMVDPEAFTEEEALAALARNVIDPMRAP